MKTILLSILLSCAALIPVSAATGDNDLNILQAEYAKPGVAESFVAGKAWFPFPAYEDRTGWAALFGPDAEKVIKRGEQLLDYQWQYIPASAYLAFERTGDRQAMEKPEGANRGAMIALILAELAEGKGRFIDQLADGIWLAAQQPSWVLSAHQPRQRTKRSLPDAREQLIDLASGRYGSIVSIAYHFFHREFDKLDPSISVATENAVRRNILDPYLDQNQHHANWWLGLASKGAMLNNWTPWCNSDVILSFLLMEKNQERLDRAIAQSVKSMDLFLNYIQKDGACEEGPAYWGAAAGKVYDYLQIMYDASGETFSLFGNERIRKMGEFVSRSYIGNGYVVNFADAGARLNNPNELIWNYGNAVGSKEMTDFALCCLADPKSGKFRNPAITGNDAYRALETVRFNPLIRSAVDSLNRIAAESSSEQMLRDLRRNVPPATWYPETEMCFMRNASDWFLGTKGGYNNESHNHNDVGTCVLYIRDIPVLVDAGVGTYTKQTFNKDRYKIWSMQCDWHNLPMINGTAQPAGAQYRSKNVSCNLSKGLFSLDLADAYPPESECRKWVRTYRLALKGTPSVTIADSFELNARRQPDVEHFLVRGSVVLPGETHGGRTLPDGELLIVCDEGPVVKMTFPASLKASVDVMELTDRKFSGVWGPSLRRINLTSKPDAPTKGNYEFRITETGKK